MSNENISTQSNETTNNGNAAQSAKQSREDFQKSLEPGMEVTGVVTEVQPRFAKVELQFGLRLLLHVSQVSGKDQTERDNRMKSLAVGDSVTALIVSTKDRDDKPRLGLSEKSRDRKLFLDSLVVGSSFTGKVAHKVEFGAFIDLGYGVQGLLHCSEVPGMSRDQRDAYLSRLTIGDEITVRLIKSQEKEGKRLLGLSVVSLMRDARLAQMPGTVVKGTVVRSEDGQYLVDLGAGITANLSMDEVSGQLHRGDHVRVQVNGVLSTENGTVSVSRDGLKAKPRARVRTVLSTQEKQEKQSKKDKKQARKGR